VGRCGHNDQAGAQAIFVLPNRCAGVLSEFGPVGVKEIERLIKKLELDKEILADQEDDEAAN
jgi:hypothetical protein